MPFINTFEEFGIERGRLEDIKTVLEARFPDASSQLMSEIPQIFDLEQLTKILRAAATVAGPDELRKLGGSGSDLRFVLCSLSPQLSGQPYYKA